MDIGSRIRAARKAAGMSQGELARRADMSLNGVAQLEQGGRTDPHYSTLSKLALALGVSVQELLEEEEAAAPKGQAPSSPSEEGRRSAYPAVTNIKSQRARHALAELAESLREGEVTPSDVRAAIEGIASDIASGVEQAAKAGKDSDNVRDVG